MDAFDQLIELQAKLPAKTRTPGAAGKLADEDVALSYYETQFGTLSTLADRAAELYAKAAGAPRCPTWCADNMQRPTDVPSRRKLLNTLRVLKAETVPVRVEEAPPGPVAVKVPDGTYTVVFGSADDYLTLNLSDASWAKRPPQPPNTQGVKLMTGPDNTDLRGSFQFVGFLLGDHWKPSRGASVEGRLAQAIEILTGDPATAGERYAMQSSRCSRCLRKLTVPASLHRGLGPECARLLAG